MNTGGDETVNQGSSCVSGERRADRIYVAEMNERRAGEIVDMSG